jgi:hypothetical protein
LPSDGRRCRLAQKLFHDTATIFKLNSGFVHPSPAGQGRLVGIRDTIGVSNPAKTTITALRPKEQGSTKSAIIWRFNVDSCHKRGYSCAGKYSEEIFGEP